MKYIYKPWIRHFLFYDPFSAFDILIMELNAVIVVLLT
jgi:hypothetical protein